MNIKMGELTKLVVCCLIIISAVILGSTHAISSEATVGLLTGSLGYVFGNGHGILSAAKEIQRPRRSD